MLQCSDAKKTKRQCLMPCRSAVVMDDNRGLVTNNQGEPRLNESQLFAVYIPDSLRQQLDQKILRQVEQAAADARQRKGNVSSLIKGTGKPNDSLLKARDEVAELWKQMVDEVERNHAVQVVNPTYAQMVMQLPPEASHTSPVFVHDFFRSFATTLFLGSEVCAQSPDSRLGSISSTAYGLYPYPTPSSPPSHRPN
ncbi:hypothetical protein V8C86DRAFT_611981 [Haematococcus lacustris]